MEDHIDRQPGINREQQLILMPLPPRLEGVPTGLEYLTLIDTVIIQQMYETLEIFSGIETGNKYMLKNANGELIYYAAEVSNCWEKCCCGKNRGATILVIDNFGRAVISLERPTMCCECSNCFACEGLGDKCVVECPPGNQIGQVFQKVSVFGASFNVRDNEGNKLFSIEAGGGITSQSFHV